VLVLLYFLLTLLVILWFIYDPHLGNSFDAGTLDRILLAFAADHKLALGPQLMAAGRA
jgi:hypothetical protein